ncbi:hypothetical protein HYC85_026637 [Camellia sinensis]|uniref:Uncharacterized protein n=1 Tax=Camellia sinensis TaxID=4442 RepID=A0A7J7G7T6_CAMSI|nr:hypothetical protein HYC85_026637 [Camellia sinensis]
MGLCVERPIPLTSVLIFRSTEYTTAIDFWFAGCVVAELLLRQDIGDKWNQLPEEEKNKLDKAQQQAVTDMGFHGILSLRCTHIDHDLCHWLVQNFDPSTHSLNVHGLRMLLTIEDVHELMGLPSNGLPVKLKESVDEIRNLCDELAVKNKFVPFTSLKSYLLETKDAGTEFKRKFVLYIIGALLCPTTKAGVHQSFIQMLFYLEQFARKRELVATSNSIPRLSYWGNSEIKQGLNQIKALGGYLNVEVALPSIVEKSNAVTLSQGRIGKNDDSRLAKVEKQVIEIHALLVQGHKDTRQDEDEKRLTKVENQVEKILELLEKHMPVDGEQVKTPPSKLLAEQRLVKMENQVGQILELLERRIPFDGGHVKTPPTKLHEEHRIDIEMVGFDDSGIKKVAANSLKFVDEDEIRNMNDKEPMETLRLRKTKPILTPPNAKAVAKKRAKLVGGKALNNEQLPIPQKGRSRAKKSDTKAVEVNAVTMSSSCSVVRGPQTRGTQNCKASQWLRTPFVKFDLFDNLLDQLGGNVVPEIPKIINLIVVKLTNKQRKKFLNKDHKVWYFPTHVSVNTLAPFMLVRRYNHCISCFNMRMEKIMFKMLVRLHFNGWKTCHAKTTDGIVVGFLRVWEQPRQEYEKPFEMNLSRDLRSSAQQPARAASAKYVRDITEVRSSTRKPARAQNYTSQYVYR